MMLPVDAVVLSLSRALNNIISSRRVRFPVGNFEVEEVDLDDRQEN